MTVQNIHPDPKPYGALWVVKWPHQPCTQTTRRCRAVWSLMGLHLLIQTIWARGLGVVLAEGGWGSNMCPWESETNAYPLGCMDWELATPTMHPDHTQTPSPMEPYGLSSGHTNHAPRPHPDPEPYGASWVVKWPHQPCTQATPRPRAPWASRLTKTNKPCGASCGLT